jgi:hypothetical protein
MRGKVMPESSTMKNRTRFALGLVTFLTLLAGFVLLAAGVVHYDLGAQEQARLAELLSPRLELVLGLAVLGLGLAGGLFAWAYRTYVAGVLSVTEAASRWLRCAVAMMCAPSVTLSTPAT